jgi:hypothetical protein
MSASLAARLGSSAMVGFEYRNEHVAALATRSSELPFATDLIDGSFT